jgi:hypothetical protein
MENQKNSETKGLTKLRKKVVTGGVMCFSIIALLSNSTGVLNNVVGISSFFHAKPTTVAANLPAQVSASPAKPQANNLNRPAVPSIPVAQTSSGNNSPNLNGVQGSLRFQAGAQGTPTSPASPGKRSARAIKPANAAVTQISTGDGSPNISNVGGDVDLRYPAPAKDNN